MAIPLTLQEQLKETYFVPDYKLVVCCATSKYDAVSRIDENGKTVQALDDLPSCKDDCAALRIALAKYHITDTGPGDIYRIEDNPSAEHKDAILLSIKKRLRDNPHKNFLIVFVLAGHGGQEGSKQVLLLNEFKERSKGKGFYAGWGVEADIREIARTFPNSYSIAFFTSSREIIESKRLNGFASKRGGKADSKTGSKNKFVADLSDEEEELKDTEKDLSNTRQNVAFFFGCKPGVGFSADMIEAIINKLLHKYEKNTFSVLFPKIFDEL